MTVSHKLTLTHFPQEEMNERLEMVQMRTTSLSQSILSDDTDAYESACRGEERGKADIARWCSVYCGGSKPVIKILKEIATESGMHTKFETFDW